MPPFVSARQRRSGEASAGYVYLTTSSEASTETLSRLLVAASERGEATVSLEEALLARQGRGGGFGDYPGYDETPLATAYALMALARTGYAASPLAEGAILYLLDRRDALGRWEGSSEEDTFRRSTVVLDALNRYRFRYALSDTLALSDDYLLSELAARSGAMDPATLSAALLALAPGAAHREGYPDAAARLQGMQGDDGSWANSVYATALAACALLR
ncbi:hypothetical protein [Endothiovibrio diazotrophicus]